MIKVCKTSLVSLVKQYFPLYESYKLSDFVNFDKGYRCPSWSVCLRGDVKFVLYQGWGTDRLYLGVEYYNDERSCWFRVDTVLVSI